MIDSVHIDPSNIYDDDALYSALGVSVAVLARARRAGQLRFARKGKRILYLGQWVLDWIRTDISPKAEGA
jgi:hypothetical protein